MNNQDIKTLIRILSYKQRKDLAKLLEGCFSEVYSSGQYGSRYNSVLAEFVIYAPIPKFYDIKKLKEADKEFILSSILDIYPIADDEPEIQSFDVRVLKESKQSASSEPPTFIERNIRVFISYSHQDAKLAGGIKRGLTQLGMDVFLAHEDITPSAEWIETILENLNSTDIFMPIITEQFRGSYWTDQESGIAFAKDKIIVPISVSNNHPYGFINRFQSAKIKDYEAEPIPYIIQCDDIVEAIIKVHPKIADQILDSLVKAFKESFSYDNAGALSRLLTLYDELDKVRIKEIFEGATENGQIFESRTARPHLKTLFRKYQKHLDADLINKLVDKMGDDFKS